MKKPVWRVRASTYVVDSPHMRLRADEVELPDGTILPNYYVRESLGFATVLAVTGDERAVLVRQYRYGADSVHLELPAGMLNPGETALECALRELAEETGYEAERWELAAEFHPEPVRSPSLAHVYVATGARKTGEQRLDPTEHLEVELVPLARLRSLLADGTINAGASIVAGYRALDYLGRL